MSHHAMVKCSECGKVIWQCPCPGDDKNVSFEVCDQCKERL